MVRSAVDGVIVFNLRFVTILQDTELHGGLPALAGVVGVPQRDGQSAAHQIRGRGDGIIKVSGSIRYQFLEV